ncbi:MAG TPA: S41 family peptidase [Candidatus Hydrogenedentes bacterium]|nr:S41 family peptidase [Candidatus Hydrogenedentota bacterium]
MPRSRATLSRFRLAPLAAVCLLLAGCVQSRIPGLGLRLPFPAGMNRLDTLRYEGDYQDLSWTESFDALHAKLSREYPFTEWKGIAWEELYDRFSLRVADAQARDDARAYYLALREYVHSIPDSYVDISMEAAYRQEAVGGGFGFSVAPLADDRLIVYRVAKNGPAEAAGICWGAEILEWNGVPVRQALEQAPAEWASAPAPTYVGRLLDKCMLLTRGPVGSEARVVFQRPGEKRRITVILTAQNDQYLGMGDIVDYSHPYSEMESPFEAKILDGGVGLLRIHFQSATMTAPFPERAYKKAVERFAREKVRGVVLDLRGNTGGDLKLARVFAAPFLRESRSLGCMVCYDPDKGGFALETGECAEFSPELPGLDVPVVVLVHRTTKDTGQLIALALQGLPNVTVMGFLGTDGALAKVGGEIRMPRGHVIHYPIGRLVDASGRVVVSTDARDIGGILPDIVPPLTPVELDAHFNQGRDPLLDMAVARLTGAPGA